MQNVHLCAGIQVQPVILHREVAMELAKEAYNPRLTLEHWIGDNKFAPSVASTGVKSIDDIKRGAALANSSSFSAAAKLLTQPEVTVTNGRIQMDGTLYWLEVVIPPLGGTESSKPII